LRILGQHRGPAGGGGLLVVLDRVADADDGVVDGLAADIPVALIDRRTLASLNRLGAASPLADAEPVYEASATIPADVVEHPLSRRAKEGLAGARVLLQQGCPGPAVDLLQGALLAAAARRAGRAAPVSAQQAGIWLYSEALPAGQLNESDAAVLMRAIALGQAAEGAPEALLNALAEDASQAIDAWLGAAETV